MPARKPRTALTLRQEVALRFTTAIVAPMAEKILNVEDNESVDESYRLLAREGFAMADAFLAVADQLDKGQGLKL